MRSPNPFTPMFGTIPAHMAGRRQVIAELSKAIENGYGDPNLCSIIIGARGTGKTALLTSLAAQAEASGWVCANATAAPGMLEDIYEQSLRATAAFTSPNATRRLTGIFVGNLLDLEWENTPRRPGNWRTRMSDLTDQLQEQGIGLFITIDEVRIDLDEMKQLVTVYQHFIREQRTVGLLMAGLPQRISALLADKDISFIRRARQHKLGRIPDNEVRDAYRATIEQAGRAVENDALREAVVAADGFPYMMQLVGYRAWEENPSEPAISAEDTRRGIALANEELETGILQNTYRELSRGDLRFLAAMLPDEGDSSMTGIASRMGVKSNYASQYKRRLLEQGIIGERGGGYLGFDLPRFREYAKERIEAAGITPRG